MADPVTTTTPRNVAKGARASSPTSAVTACQRCRKHKIRCSRDVPVCKKCRDSSTTCDYPPPPDRKLLAAQRVQNLKNRARRESDWSSDHSNCLQEQRSLPPDSEGSKARPIDLPTHNHHGSMDHSEPDTGDNTGGKYTPQDHRAATPPLQASMRRTTLPSPEVAAFLFDIYFSRLYNASLLFHKEKFLAQYVARRIPDFVALSIFALASIFLRPSPDDSPHNDDDEDGVDLGISMLSASNSVKQGLEWAIAASQRALMQSDVPRIETVQACQNLALYWFSRGEADRTHMHSLIAYKTCRVLNLHLQKVSSDDPKVLGLTEELQRRCFWSCWITSCISQDNANFNSKPFVHVAGLPFPSDEGSFASGQPIPTEFFGENGSIQSLNPEGVSPPSVMAELVKLYGLWWEIQHFIKQHKNVNPAESSDRIKTILELDQRLGLVFENLHPAIRFQNVSLFLTAGLDPYKLFSIHSLYLLCACALHSSIVPLFSETPSTPLVTKKFIRLSAEESVKHAAVMLDMAVIFLSTRPDISRLPSITGYAMFVACAVYFKSLLAQKKLESQGLSCFKGAIAILERLKEYWSVNQSLWAILKNLFESQGLNINAISENYSQSQPNFDWQSTDVERIVSYDPNPQGTGSTDIYTYVASQERKGPVPRHQSDTSSITRSQSTQNTPSPRNTSSPGSTEKQNAAHREAKNTEIRTLTLHPQQHLPSPPQVPITHGLTAASYHPPFANSSHSMRRDYAGISALMASDFMTPGSISEENRIQNQVSLGTMTGMGEGMNEPFGTEMELDGANVWWDQSYGDVLEANFDQSLGGVQGIRGENSDVEGYSFETLSFY